MYPSLARVEPVELYLSLARVEPVNESSLLGIFLKKAFFYVQEGVSASRRFIGLAADCITGHVVGHIVVQFRPASLDL